MTHRLSKSKPCQKMHDIAWRLVNSLMTEYCPTWCIAVQNRKLSTSSQLRLRLVLGYEPLKLTRTVSYIGHIWINLSATSESFTLTSSYFQVWTTAQTTLASWKLDFNHGFRKFWQDSTTDVEDRTARWSLQSATWQRKEFCQWSVFTSCCNRSRPFPMPTRKTLWQ